MHRHWNDGTKFTGSRHVRSILSFVLLGSCLLPLVAQAAPPPASAYAALPVAATARLSPDGKSVAFINGAGDVLALMVSDVDSGQSRPIPTGNWNPDWIRWKDNQTLLAGLSQTAISDRGIALPTSRLFAFTTDGGKAQAVVFDRALDPGVEVIGDPGNLVPNLQDRVISPLSDHPGHILMEVPQDSVAYPAVFDVSLWDNVHRLTQGSFGEVVHWVADQTGTARAGIALHEESRGGDYHYHLLARVSTKDDWHRLDIESHDVAFDATNPDTLYALITPHSGPASIVQIDIPSGAIQRTLISSPSGALQLLTSNGVMVGYVTRQNIIYTDPSRANDAKTIATALKISDPELIDRSTDDQRVTAIVSMPGQPPKLWLLDRTQTPANLSPLLTDYDDIPGDQIAVGKWEHATARDGLDIPLIVTLPIGAKGPIPFVVLPHGGPTSNDRIAFDWLVQFLVSRGYGVMQPQFRGSTGFGADFQQKGLQQWGLAMQDDITDATRWLVIHDLADPQKICIVGASFGGYAALEGAVKEPGLYACAAAIAPVTDLPAFLHDRRVFAFNDANIPAIGDDTSKLEDTSPADHADRIQIPILLIHGRNDFTVPVQQTERMEKALQKAGKTEQTIYLPTADHYLRRVADRLTVLRALEAFLAKSL